MPIQLSVVSPVEEKAAAKAQRLMLEAGEAAREQIVLLENALKVVGELAADIANGGAIYPAGIRDLSKKMSEDAPWCAGTISAILKNTSPRSFSIGRIDDTNAADDGSIASSRDAGFDIEFSQAG